MTQLDHRGYRDAPSGHDAMMIGLQAFHWWDWLGYWGHQAFHLAFIWQLSRINGGPNFYDSTLARPKVSITSEAETQGDKEHSSQHLQAGQCRSFCQCPVFAKIFFFCDNTFLSTTQCLLIRRANCANCANCATCSWKVCPLCVFSCALSTRQNVRTWQNNKINNNHRSWWQSPRKRWCFKSKHRA